MASVIDICNMALSTIGASEINSLDEASAEARACKRFYEPTRDKLLQGPYVWRWAKRRAVLAELTNPRPAEWGHCFQIPVLCIVPRGVVAYAPDADYAAGNLPRHNYDVEDGKIYANLSPAVLLYTARVTDPSAFPPLFVEALYHHLAVRLVMPISKDAKMRADVYQMAMIETSKAEVADANMVKDFWALDGGELTGIYHV